MTCSISSKEIEKLVVGTSNGIGTAILSPSLQSMINSFKSDGEGQGDRDLFLALLTAKTAEDKRLMALDNFRAEQLRAANTLYAHSAYQAQQQEMSQRQQGSYFFNPTTSNPSTSYNNQNNHNHNHNNQHYRIPRSPLSPPPSTSTTTTNSTSISQQYSRENSQTPSSNFSTTGASNGNGIGQSKNSSTKRKATNSTSIEHTRPQSSSGSSSSTGNGGIEREVMITNSKRMKPTSTISSTTTVKPSHAEAMNALRARCERNTRDRQQLTSIITSPTILSQGELEQEEQGRIGGAELFKSISLPLSSTSSKSSKSSKSSTTTNQLSPHPSPALSSVSTNASSLFSPPLPSPATPTQFITSNNQHLNIIEGKGMMKKLPHLSMESVNFLAAVVSTERPPLAIVLPSISTITTSIVTHSPIQKEVEIKSPEGSSSNSSLRRLLNSNSNARNTVTRVSDVRGE